MSMSRKDYVLIAEVFSEAHKNLGNQDHPVLRYLADQMAAAFAEENPLFDTRTFLTACHFGPLNYRKPAPEIPAPPVAVQDSAGRVKPAARRH